MTETERSIRDFIVEEIVSDRRGAELTVEESLLEGGMIDSMDLQRLVAFLEERFDVTVADDMLVPEHFENIRSIGEMIERIR